MEEPLSQGRLVWEQRVAEGYIWSLSISRDLLAILAPSPQEASDIVHVFNAGTSQRIQSLLLGSGVCAVAITPEQELLFDRQHDSDSQSTEPEVFIGYIGQGPFSPYRFKYIGEMPSYNSAFMLGQILILPGQRRALIGGVSDRYDTKGFLLLADWTNGAENGTLRKIAAGIDEAPHDIAVANDLAYIATGRGGTIDVMHLDAFEFSNDSVLTPAGFDTFKPMRVAVTNDYVVAASYNQLFWWQGLSLVGAVDLSNAQDCINGLAPLSGNKVICTLTYSNSLVVMDLDVMDSHSPAKPLLVQRHGDFVQQAIEQPCFVVTEPSAGDDFYITGHSNGIVSGLSLINVHNLVGAGR